MGLLKNIANSAWSHAKKGAGTIWKGAKAVGSGLKKGGSMLIDAYKDLDDDTKNRVASLVGGGIQALGSLPTPVAPLLSAIGAGAKYMLKGAYSIYKVYSKMKAPIPPKRNMTMSVTRNRY